MSTSNVMIVSFEPLVQFLLYALMFLISLVMTSYVFINFKKLHLFGKFMTPLILFIYGLLYVYCWEYFDWVDYKVYEEMAVATSYEETKNNVATYVSHSISFGSEIYFLFSICIICLFIIHFIKKN